jgi:pantoate--beta-alanine ligase
MQIARTATALREQLQHWRGPDSRIAFVPTMGNLHEGHLQLVRHAKAVAGRVVVSIFVNPMQFGPQEDFAQYPRTLQADQRALMDIDADLLYLPDVDELYPGGVGQTTVVEVPGLNALLEGECRPTHFNGVSTVVTKLFNQVQPDIAVFGEKDYQQLLLIRRMVADLCMPIHVDSVATVREPDGLAMSSRNRYLSAADRMIALQLYQTLLDVQGAVLSGERDYHGLEQAALRQLTEAGFTTDYVSIRRAADLAEPAAGDSELVVLAAATVGRTRLIDNIRISMG